MKYYFEENNNVIWNISSKNVSGDSITVSMYLDELERDKIERLYEKAVTNGLKDNYNKYSSKVKIKAIAIKNRHDKFLKSAAGIQNIIDVGSIKTEKVTEDIVKFVSMVVSHREGDDEAEDQAEKMFDDISVIFDEFTNSIYKIAYLGKYSSGADKKTFVPEKSANEVIAKYVYETDKIPQPSEMTIAQFASFDDFKFLSKESLKSVEKIVNTAKKSVKNINSLYKKIDMFEKLATKYEKAGNGEYASIFRSIYGKYVGIRNFASYANGLIIAWYGAFLRDNGYLYRALQLLMSKKNANAYGGGEAGSNNNNT